MNPQYIVFVDYCNTEQSFYGPYNDREEANNALNLLTNTFLLENKSMVTKIEKAPGLTTIIGNETLVYEVCELTTFPA